MHFWIDKRSQTCGFNGRYQVPPSISGYGRNQRILCGNFYPKPPMVTPVHRFQSIESVANNSIRFGVRSSPSGSALYHNNARPQNSQATLHYNGPTNNLRLSQMGRSIDNILPSNGINNPTTNHHHQHQNQNHSSTPTAKLKCGIWIFFAIVAFILAGSKYYFHGINIGVEVLVFCSLLVIFLMIGGLISLCEAIATYSTTTTLNTANNPTVQPPQTTENANTTTAVVIPEQQQQSQQHNVDNLTTINELPPPPYHIAIMLTPQQNNSNTNIQIIRDSPPPSYEKAVN